MHNKATNFWKSFMSIHCGMDREMFYNRIQSVSFNHQCMAAALSIHYGVKWMIHVWQSLFDSVGETLDTYSCRMKMKHTFDSAREVLQNYKKRQLSTKLSKSTKDLTNGDAPAEPDIDKDELKSLCNEYISCLVVTEQQQQAIAIQTIYQADDPIGEWKRQWHGWVTASVFGNIRRMKESFASLTISSLYSKARETPVMRYGKLHGGEAWQSYNICLKLTRPDALVAMRGLHVDPSHIAKIINITLPAGLLAGCFPRWISIWPNYEWPSQSAGYQQQPRTHHWRSWLNLQSSFYTMLVMGFTWRRPTVTTTKCKGSCLSPEEPGAIV